MVEYNRRVKQYFSDHDAEWKPNIADKRSSMRVACTILDSDNHAMMAIRMSFFFDLLGANKRDLMVYHGVPENIEPPVEGHPKVRLYFSQDAESVPKGYAKVDAEISFRLMNETAATFTPENARSLATKIKQQFVSNNKPVMFTKGKDIYAYKDVAKGYRLQVYCTKESDAKDIIERCLEVQNVPYDEKKLTVHIPKKTSQPKTAKTLVYGKQREGKRFRPISNVFFRYAVVEIPGMNKEVVLYDATGRLGGLIF
nr:hypothetical protein [Nostoc sp. EkiNYC01]